MIGGLTGRAGPVRGKALRRAFKDLAKRQLRRVLEGGQRFGVHVLPANMYAEVPDLRRLKTEQRWRAPRSMHHVRGVDLDHQEARLGECFSPDISRHLADEDVYADARDQNGGDGYGPIEAEVLFAFVATHRPSRIVQVGCGLSTAVILAAARFAGYTPDVVAVDPRPSSFLKSSASAGAISLHAVGAEQVDDAVFEALGPGDLLFVDSTHASIPGGEVNRILLEIVPRLAEGAWAHFHDINFPYEYSRELLGSDLFFPHESVLLHALLVSNAQLRIEFSLSMLHYGRQGGVARLMPRYRPAPGKDGLADRPSRGSCAKGHFPSSVFLKATTGGVAT